MQYTRSSPAIGRPQPHTWFACRFPDGSLTPCDHAYMWGGLWHFPFDPAVWGTVAQWASALLTSGALLIAALVYWRDSQLSRSAQAKQVRIRIRDRRLGAASFWVQNDSGESIFDVHILVTGPYSFYRGMMKNVETGWADMKSVPKFSSADIAEGFAESCEEFFDTKQYKTSEVERIAADQSHEFLLPSVTRFNDITVAFTDNRGTEWQYRHAAMAHQKLVRLTGSRVRRWRWMRLSRLWHPIRTVREIRFRMLALYFASETSNDWLARHYSNLRATQAEERPSPDGE